MQTRSDSSGSASTPLRSRLGRSVTRFALSLLLLSLLTTSSGCSHWCPAERATTPRSCPEPTVGDAERWRAVLDAGLDLPHYRRLLSYCWPAEAGEVRGDDG